MGRFMDRWKCDGGVTQRSPVKVRSLIDWSAKSALGQSRTSVRLWLMSAIHPKADMHRAFLHVRFVPIADMRGPRRPRYCPGGYAPFAVAVEPLQHRAARNLARLVGGVPVTPVVTIDELHLVTVFN